MPLFEFTNKTKYGQLRKRIVYQPTTAFTTRGGFGDFEGVAPFRYMSRTKFQPGLVMSDGKKYMVPDWLEVLPETTISDIKPFEEEERGRPKKIASTSKPQSWKFESKSDPGSYYEVKQVSDFKVSCTCSGQYRAKDRKCRHIKEIMLKLGIKCVE